MIPPCHHWSWSSTYVASDHFTTRSQVVFAPGRRTAVTSNSAARCESLLSPTSSPLTLTIRTLSAAPTWSTTRRPAHAAGTSNVALVDAGRVVVGPAGGGRGTASGRSCRAGGRRSPASSSSRDGGLAPVRRRGGVGRAEQLEPPRAVEVDPLPDRRGGRRASAAAAARQLRREPTAAGPRAADVPVRSAISPWSRRAQAADEVLLQGEVTRGSSGSPPAGRRPRAGSCR